MSLLYGSRIWNNVNSKKTSLKRGLSLLVSKEDTIDFLEDKWMESKHFIFIKYYHLDNKLKENLGNFTYQILFDSVLKIEIS